MRSALIHTEPDGAGHVVSILGELDAHTAPLLRADLAATARPTSIDCRLCSFIDAAGVSLLVECHRIHAAPILASDPVARVLEMCSLTDLMGSVTSRPFLLDRAPFGVAIFDTDLRFGYVNQTMARINQVPAAAHLGRRPADIFDLQASDLTPQLERAHRTGVGTDEVLTASVGTLSGTYRVTIYPSSDSATRRVVAIVEPSDLPDPASGPSPHRSIRFRPITPEPS